MPQQHLSQTVYEANSESLPWKHHKVSTETETNRADLLLAGQRKQYAEDVAFVTRHEENYRARRHQHRVNLRERRWEAYERIAMLQEDNLDYWKRSSKRKHLSSQVITVAQRLENRDDQEIAELSASLPKTPEEFAKPEGERAPQTPLGAPRTPLEVQSTPAVEPAPKRPKTEAESTAQNVALTLDRWMVEKWLEDQPSDPGLPRARVERKDPKFRWACYARTLPRLRSVNTNLWGVAPPYGAHLIENYRLWKATQVSP